MSEVSVNVQAYSKVILHTAKYPHCSVNGVLLAQDKSKNKDSKVIKVVDAIPLFHLALGLAPMMEVALTQIDFYCKAQGLVVAGYYQAHVHVENCSPDFIALKIGDRLHDYFPGAFIAMIDNTKLSMDCEEDPFIIYQQHDGKWKPVKGSLDKGSLAMASTLLHSRAYRGLVDFDCHLDDIRFDWKNLEINELLSHAS